jgi:hypothetical protein
VSHTLECLISQLVSKAGQTMKVNHTIQQLYLSASRQRAGLAWLCSTDCRRLDTYTTVMVLLNNKPKQSASSLELSALLLFVSSRMECNDSTIPRVKFNWYGFRSTCRLPRSRVYQSYSHGYDSPEVSVITTNITLPSIIILLTSHFEHVSVPANPYTKSYTNR